MFFWIQFAQKRDHFGQRSNWEKKFFHRNNKSRSSAFRKLLFYQNIICFDWVIDLFLSWVMFSIKKVSFPAETAVVPTDFEHNFLSCCSMTIWIKFLLNHMTFRSLGISIMHTTMDIILFNRKLHVDVIFAG